MTGSSHDGPSGQGRWRARLKGWRWLLLRLSYTPLRRPHKEFLFWKILPAALCLTVALGCSSDSLPHEGKTTEELEAMLQKDDPASQAQGALGLSEKGPEARSAVPRLVELLASPSPPVRENAALALGKIGPDAAPGVAGLTRCLGDPKWAVRRQAALALGRIGPKARPAREPLQRLTRDPDRLVRQAATEALEKIGK